MERSRIKGSTAFIIIILITSQLLFIFSGIDPSGPRFREHCQAAKFELLSKFAPLTKSDSGGTVSREKERSRNNRTLIVNGSGSRDYRSISGAIMGASDGDTVYVEAGTYNESFEISKNIKLMGAGAEKTTIRGHGHYYNSVIYINTHGVEMTGFTITTEESDLHGISIIECHNCSIIDNIIVSHNKGISLIRTRDIAIIGNTISNLTGDSNEKQLISIQESTHIGLMRNELIGNGISISGERLEHWNTHIVDDENTIDGKEIIFW